MDPGAALIALVDRVTPRLRELSDSETSLRPAPGKWCGKEILGHLVDSAVNNQSRFVRGAQEDELVFPGYDQDSWVRLQHYDARSWSEVIDLWLTMNRHVARVMEAVPPETRNRPAARHNFHEIGFRPAPADKPSTLGWLMEDYLEHLKHHLRQILGAASVD